MQVHFLARHMNNRGDIGWHESRAVISQAFRFEKLGFEEVQENFCRDLFRDVEIGEIEVEALAGSVDRKARAAAFTVLANFIFWISLG